MTQRQLNQLVASATGEAVSEIQRRGFSVADPWEVRHDPEPDDLEPQLIDWDEHDLQRNTAFFSQPRRTLRPVS